MTDNEFTFVRMMEAKTPAQILNDLFEFDRSKNTERQVLYRNNITEQEIISVWQEAMRVLFGTTLGNVTGREIATIFVRENILSNILQQKRVEVVVEVNYLLPQPTQMTLDDVLYPTSCATELVAINGKNVNIFNILGYLLRSALPLFPLIQDEKRPTTLKSNYYNITNFCATIFPSTIHLQINASPTIFNRYQSGYQILYDMCRERKDFKPIHRWVNYSPESIAKRSAKQDGTRCSSANRLNEDSANVNASL